MIDAIDIKLAVMRHSCGMQSLDELKFLYKLEEIYLEAYKRGADDALERATASEGESR